jgi:virginiamycin B lyase
MTLAGVLTEFTISSPDTGPAGIALGHDGNIWFTESTRHRIGRMSANGELLNEYEIPSGAESFNIARGTDGNMWFTESLLSMHVSYVSKITPSGVVTEYPTPVAGVPNGIVGGPDGDMWFTDTAIRRIGRTTSMGVMQEFLLPTGHSHAVSIAPGSALSMWFTELDNYVGRVRLG